MSIVSNPQITVNIESQGGVVGLNPQKILVIGQKSTLGSAPADKVVKNIGNAGQEDGLFGTRSMLATMCRTVKKYNKISRLDVLPLDDPTVGDVKATATITIDTSPTANGNLSIAVQSERYYTFSTGVQVGDTTVDIAERLVTLINASDTILCTAANAGTNVMTLTASHAGTELDNMSLALLETVNGLGVTLSGFSGGAGAVTLPDLDNTLGAERYQTIVFPASYGFTEIKSFIDARFNVSNAVEDGVVVTLATDANAPVAIGTSQSLNSKSIVYFSMPERNIGALKGSPMVELNVTTSSYFAAVRALRLEDGADIAGYLAGAGNPSTFGGAARAALGYHQTPFEDLPVIQNNLGWSKADQEILTKGGVSYFGNNSESSSIVVSDVVTTYTTTAGGVPDETFHYLNAVDTSSVIREFFFNNLKAQYVQTVLTDGDLVKSFNQVVDAGSIRGFLSKLYTDLGELPYTLVQYSQAAKKFFRNNAQVTLNIEVGSVDVLMIVPIVGQLRSLNATLQVGFSLNTN